MILNLLCLIIGSSTLLMLGVLYMQGRIKDHPDLDSKVLEDALERIVKMNTGISWSDLEMKRIAREALREYHGEVL